MTDSNDLIPISIEVTDDLARNRLCLRDVFERLRGLPYCLWLDSAAMPNADLGRYSFLTADPVDILVANAGGPDPWPQIQQWCTDLPKDRDDRLPPFQGGVAGLFGYEAASWLENVPLAVADDLPTAAVALGLYDWVIATDHQLQRTWLVSQGLGAKTMSRRSEVAKGRAIQVLTLLGLDLSVAELADNAISPSSEGTHEPWRTTEAGSVIGDLTAGVSLGQHETFQANVTSNFCSEGFQSAVAEVVRRICDGDSFQVNLAQRLLREAVCHPWQLYMTLRKTNPAPFGCYFDAGDFQVMSSSPEGFLKVRDGLVETRPIKGTVRRTGDVVEDQRLAKQLTSSIKDQAENVMIVDLMRNDLSRVCEDGSVQVDQLCKVEKYQYVQHLVSVVTGRLKESSTIVDLLQACFPGGSVTGAPKIEAMRCIAALEPNRRGPYCGSIGYIGCGGVADFNILIRTITASGGYWQIPVGGGITARSEPVAEEAETWTKAKGMLEAIDRIVASDDSVS